MIVNRTNTLRTLAAAVFAATTGQAFASNVYDAISNPEPYNLPSLGYQATSTQEFGDYIQLAGTDRVLTTIRVGMSDWAVKSSYLDINDVPLSGFEHVTMDAGGYYHDLTLNLYEVDTSGADPAVGSQIGTKTVTAYVPWRPENQGVNQPWLAPDSNTYNGIFFTVDFDFTGDGITLPDDVIVALAFNTNTHGYSPINASGPYESLNFALASNPGEPTVGADGEVDALFWNTSYAGFYTDGGVGGVNVFRRDTNWSPFTPAIEINAVPEPASLGLIALGGALLLKRRKH